MKGDLAELQNTKFENISLPLGWTTTRVGDIMNVIRGASPRPKGDPRYFGGNIPWIMISDITKEKGKVISKTRDTVTPAGAKLSRYLKKGTLILSNSGTVCVPKILAIDACIHDGFVAFPLIPQELNILYLYYWFDYIRPRIINENRQGVTQVNLNTDIVRRIPISLCPSDEQNRIVAKIEELFTKLDAGIEYLRKMQILLKQYRQSVLKYAFEGKLSEKWREENSAIVRGILDSSKANNLSVEPGQKMPPLPIGWVYSNLTKLGELSRGRSKHRPRDDPKLFGGRYPFIQTGEVKNSNGLITTYQKAYSDFGLKQSKLWPKRTLCITIAANIAETAILDISACFPDSIVGFITNNDVSNVKYVYYFLRSIKDKIEAYAPATAQKNINIEILKDIAIPLPSIAEQNKLVELIDFHFSLIDNCSSSLNYLFRQVRKLRQSILKNAFEGNLIRQDPNDEPAEILLQRIKKERTNSEIDSSSKKTKNRFDNKQMR